MGIKTTKGWLLAAVCLLPWCAASLCPQGLQYWSNESESCINCSRCDSTAKQVVIRPCQVHADTLCGPISDLNVDWSWLKPDDKPKRTTKHHEKHITDDPDDPFSEKKHHKKGHKHHIIDDDIAMFPVHHSVLDDDIEMVPTLPHHTGSKHHKHYLPKLIDEDGLDTDKKPKKHHLPSESFLSEDIDSIDNDHRMHRLPPPPPVKSTHDLEKEWKEWLIQSKNRLQHRKDDLLKTLHRESPYNEKHHPTNHKLNHPSNSFDDLEGEIFHHSAHHKDHSQKKHFSPLDFKIFDKLLNHEHLKHEEHLSLSHLLSPENRRNDLLDMMKSEDKSDDKMKEIAGNDLAFPMDSFDFRSAVPTHRLFLGEPSTVSEIMDQDFSDESEDDEDERLKEDKMAWQSAGDPSVIAVPFTATERFVWDWQAVALTSAVAACLLFFVVVAIYSVLNARHWRRLKTNFDSDMDELSVKVGLMQSQSHDLGASAADAANTNLYLEKLLENKKKTSNIYTQKRPLS